MKKNNNFISVANFCTAMGVDKDGQHLLNSRCCHLARTLKIERTFAFGVWHYKEDDLLDMLGEMKKVADKMPDDVKTVRQFIQENLPLNCYHIKHRIGKRMSELALAGSVKRYSRNGRTRSWSYHIADLEREVATLVKLSDKRSDKPMVIETPTKPGIFVRMWRWLFGK